MADPDTGGWKLDLKVPIALIATLCVQTGGALLWAGGAAERISTLERRLDKQSGVTERLARLEAQSEATGASLARIETKLDQDAKR